MEERSALALVSTKLSIPAAPATLVGRARLADALDAAVGDPNRRLVLVSAPAGSGKSTLVSAWLAGRSDDGAWLQLDEADRDPARFWSYVVGALEPLVPGLTEAAALALGAAARDHDPVVAAIVNHLEGAERPIVLVLDDVHLVAGPQIDAALERLIELAPATLTLVLSTRLDPGLRLSRLRVRDQLVEIRADDLRFEVDEAGSLLSSRAADAVSPAHVRALCERTEGWAAGLVLAGLSLASSDDRDAFVTAFQGDDRLVVDYLSEEFLEGVDPAHRERLLRTSVLERMNGPLVDAVWGGSHQDGTSGAAWLRSTADTNQLLIGLDRTGTWFRYHHLLRDLLRLEATESLGVAEVAELHRRAGRWHRDGGDLHSAVEHLLLAGEQIEAADLIADNATKLLNGGHLQTVLGYLDRVADVITEHAGCCIVRGWTTFVAGRFAEAEEWLDHARRHGSEEDLGLVAGLGTMICLARGDVAGGIVIADDSPTPSDPTHAMVQSAVLVWAGRFDDARPHIARAMEMATAAPDDFAAAVTPGYEAILEIESGNTARAAEVAAEGIARAERLGMAKAPQMALTHAVAARTDDDSATAAASARHAVELVRKVPEHLSLAYVLTSAGDVLADLGEPDGVTLLGEARAVVDRSPDPGITGTYLARAESRHGIGGEHRSVGLVEELTERELGVLRYLPSALSQRDIANELYVSLNTVKTHCQAIYRKLGVGDRKAAVQAARDLGLL